MMRLSSDLSTTTLRQDAAAVLRQVRGSNEPTVITMMSAEAYERAEHDRELLRLLARGDKEIAAGKGHSLDAVLAETDALLTEGDQ
jgi:hypothetical protein